MVQVESFLFIRNCEEKCNKTSLQALIAFSHFYSFWRFSWRKGKYDDIVLRVSFEIIE